ncbi:ArdC-like ssDNA-binding domain-containing protein [Novispirillum sp. DQ9]|uniref:ArdC-like ssDNA-binding domain-containing protein n=1 Tax=Novispirillum sp. DQ9 TaxID=3398612 RepID=UPI003C7B8259
MTKPRRDTYQDITDGIIKALETGTPPWRRPWDPAVGAPLAPMNAATNRRYRGINTLLLGMSPNGFMDGDPRWCTYQQAQERGWQVRKGEKGTGIVFFKPCPSRSDKRFLSPRFGGYRHTGLRPKAVSLPATCFSGGGTPLVCPPRRSSATTLCAFSGTWAARIPVRSTSWRLTRRARS